MTDLNDFSIQGSKPQTVHTYGTNSVAASPAYENRSLRAKAQQSLAVLLVLSAACCLVSK